mgnify:CR=1 FL=1
MRQSGQDFYSREQRAKQPHLRRKASPLGCGYLIAGSNLQAEMILEALKTEGIPAYKVDYVAECDVQGAMKILETIGLKTC